MVDRNAGLTVLDVGIATHPSCLVRSWTEKGKIGSRDHWVENDWCDDKPAAVMVWCAVPQELNPRRFLTVKMERNL